ncbi:MAG: anthranilate phosphoribosyltransferase [delta proteobacterium MLS_D]|nr:MAG: anthranilate phosphoribosyltransferase [delta proteobacterium MLS_D]
MIRNAIAKMVEGRDLQEAEMTAVMGKIMDGEGTDAQIGAFMTALRMKGETIDEVTGAARAMRRRAVRVDARSLLIVDTCGTGGDGRGTFNISTTTAFVVAAAGIVVAKHGNRAVSSGCGSADLLEALGVNIDAGIETVEACLQEIGIGFLFAPRLHPAMKYAAGPRRELGIRSIFNMLGPLTNPAGATVQLLGVYDSRLTEVFAAVLERLGSKRAFVVCGSDGIDEATVTGETRVSELDDGLIVTYNIDPSPYFGGYHDISSLAGGDAEGNAQITKAVLSGEEGPHRDVVLLNAGLAITAASISPDLSAGIETARQCIDDGSAMKVLQSLIEMTNA